MPGMSSSNENAKAVLRRPPDGPVHRVISGDGPDTVHIPLHLCRGDEPGEPVGLMLSLRDADLLAGQLRVVTAQGGSSDGVCLRPARTPGLQRITPLGGAS
jgi:hypothetical protein